MQKECTYTLDGLISREGGGALISMCHMYACLEKRRASYIQGAHDLGGGGSDVGFIFTLNAGLKNSLLLHPYI